MVDTKVMALIEKERARQDSKWGQQNHLDETWALIFLEEVGEWAKSKLESMYQVEPKARVEAKANAKQELVETVAVGIAWLEAMERRLE